MTDWEIRPFVGVGPLDLGMSKAEIRSVLGEPDRILQRRITNREYESYNHVGVHIYFDDCARLSLVDMWGHNPCRFLGMTLLGRTVSEVVKDLLSLGHAPHVTPDGSAFDSLGLSLYNPGDGIVASIYVRSQDEYHTWIADEDRRMEKQRQRAERRKALGDLSYNPFQLNTDVNTDRKDDVDAS